MSDYETLGDIADCVRDWMREESYRARFEQQILTFRKAWDKSEKQSRDEADTNPDRRDRAKYPEGYYWRWIEVSPGSSNWNYQENGYWERYSLQDWLEYFLTPDGNNLFGQIGVMASQLYQAGIWNAEKDDAELSGTAVGLTDDEKLTVSYVIMAMIHDLPRYRNSRLTSDLYTRYDLEEYDKSVQLLWNSEEDENRKITGWFKDVKHDLMNLEKSKQRTSKKKSKSGKKNKGGRKTIPEDEANTRMEFYEEVQERKRDNGAPLKEVAAAWKLDLKQARAWFEWARTHQKTDKK